MDRRDEPSRGRALGDVARELRDRVGADFRADAEEGERLAAQAALRRRGLADVAAEAADRGETVTVVAGDRRITGTVRHAARDLLTLGTAAGVVHLNLGVPVVLRVEPAAGRHVPADTPSRDDAMRRGVPSFKARLYELEMAGTEIALGVTSEPGELRGSIRAVALDHLLLDLVDGGRMAVALAAVRYAWVRSPGR